MGDIINDLVKSITEMLKVEFAFINLVNEGGEVMQAQTPTPIDLLPAPSSAFGDSFLTLNLSPQSGNEVAEDINTPQMENADLAEADQSHLETEEGAVGGVQLRSPELVRPCISVNFLYNSRM